MHPREEGEFPGPGDHHGAESLRARWDIPNLMSFTKELNSVLLFFDIINQCYTAQHHIAIKVYCSGSKIHILLFDRCAGELRAQCELAAVAERIHPGFPVRICCILADLQCYDFMKILLYDKLTCTAELVIYETSSS